MSVLPLKSGIPLAKGATRLIFQHPESPDLLVKVMRPDVVERRQSSRKRWLRWLRRYDPYLVFLREIHEFVAAHAALGCAAPFAQVVHGFLETDLGLGLVVGAVRGPDGALAPTVSQLIARGDFDATASRALDETLDAVLQSNIVLADLHEHNLVYQQGDGGAPRFVIIDGLGTSTLLPVKDWSPWINRSSKLRRIAHLRKRVAGRLAASGADSPSP
jgi:hypothetical protein